MHSFPPISITSATPFIFEPFGARSGARRITFLDVQVAASSADVYVGPAPNVPTVEQSLEFAHLIWSDTPTSVNAKDWVMATDSAACGRHLNIKPGWILTTGSVVADVGKYVVKVDGDVLTFNTALSAHADDAMIIQAPFYADIANGQVLSAGMWKQWTAESGSAFLSTALKFAVSSGTGLINLTYDFA